MLAITVGEPAGIGPDVVIALAQEARTTPWLVVGDPELLLARARQLNLPLSISERIEEPVCEAGKLSVQAVACAGTYAAGQPDTANVPGVLAALDEAIAGCLSGRYQGLVTGPMQKSVVNDAGIPFSGHTEYLAEKTGAHVVMLLVAGELRVALATTHLPLREVANALTCDGLHQVLEVLHAELALKFKLRNPRVLVCGLNPHAGEQGHLGVEEINIISPVCQQMRGVGKDIVGPLPADTLFTPRHLDSADAVLAMYHDQGLPVLKFAGFGEAVNVTLGLPFVRTSVDHGTALDIAGTGTADCGSMASALSLAADMVGLSA